jgi:hypothetical protein
VLDLGHQLFLAPLFEDDNFNRVCLVYNIAGIVCVLKNQLVLLQVAATLKLKVVFIAQEALAE